MPRTPKQVDVSLTWEEANWLYRELSDTYRDDGETPRHDCEVATGIADKIQYGQQLEIEEMEEAEAWESDIEADEREDFLDNIMFADPGGRSALRAATPDNPRNLPCPTCGTENMLTPADRALGYQCDRCSDAAEGYGP
jgi:hypothetical protein